MKLTFRTRKPGLMANPQSKNKSRVACKIEVVVQQELLQVSERTSAMVTRWSMHGRIDASTRNKQKDRWQTMGRLESQQVSRFGTTGNRVLNVTRTNINRSNVSTTGQIHEGRLAAGEKSLRKAPPCMHCCQPCRQSRSRRVQSTVANLIWVVQSSCGCATDVSLVGLRFKVSSNVRCTGKATPPNRNAPPKLVPHVHR